MGRDERLNQGQKVETNFERTDIMGRHSNHANVVQSKEEFIIDFFFVSPVPLIAVCLSRNIMSPAAAKRLLEALQKCVDDHEAIEGRPIVANNSGIEVVRG